MPRRKPQTAQRTPVQVSEIDRESLAKLGAVVQATKLKQTLRDIERAYPGTMQLADAQLARDSMALARAVKAAGGPKTAAASRQHPVGEDEGKAPALANASI